MEPSNLDEVVNLLVAELKQNTETENKVREEGIPHHGTGTNIRNQLGLWWNDINNRFDKDPKDKPALIQWFNERDIFMGDDLSMVIGEAVRTKLLEQPYDIDKTIKRIKSHWKRHGFKDGIYNPVNKKK